MVTDQHIDPSGLVEGSGSRGRPRICWFDNVVAWTGLSGSRLLYTTRNRRGWSYFTHPCSLPLHGDGSMVT